MTKSTRPIEMTSTAPARDLRRLTASAAAALSGGWMTFDGLHALTTGDYVGASGREGLGPWVMPLEAASLAPTSTGVKLAFVALGLVGLASAILHAARPQKTATRRLLAVFAVGTLWYLPIGTALSLTTLAMLSTSRRAAGSTTL